MVDDEKIRSRVTVDDFKRMQRRVIRPVPAVVNKRKIELSRINTPCAIPVKRPMKIPKPGVKQRVIDNANNRAVAPRQVKVERPVIRPAPKPVESPRPVEPPKPQRSLLRNQLENVRREPRNRGVRRSPVRGGGSINVKSIESLKNIGKGRVLIIVAAGPSILEVDLGPLLGLPDVDFMCINKPFGPVWPSKFWAFCDNTQYRANKDAWSKFDGIIINSLNVKARKSNQILIKSCPGSGFSTDVTIGYHIGRSSTYASLQVVYYMNYDMTYLFGVDMGPNPATGQLHHYGQNPDVTNENRKNRFPAEAKHYLWAAKHLPKSVRDKFVFCSSWNKWEFTKHFPHFDHEVAVDAIVDYIKGK